MKSSGCVGGPSDARVSDPPAARMRFGGLEERERLYNRTTTMRRTIERCALDCTSLMGTRFGGYIWYSSHVRDPSLGRSSQRASMVLGILRWTRVLRILRRERGGRGCRNLRRDWVRMAPPISGKSRLLPLVTSHPVDPESRESSRWPPSRARASPR